MTKTRGEIWDVDLPPPPGGQGREQTGFRPAVIVSDKPDDEKNPLIIVVLCTSKKGALRFPHTVEAEPSKANGLSMSTVLLGFQLMGLDRDRFIRKRGILEAETMQKLDQILRGLLGLEIRTEPADE
jgi:mRNA interferase MazF